jgi:hypothetical protein
VFSVFSSLLILPGPGQTYGCPGRVVTWRPIKPIFFKLFPPKTGMTNFWGRLPKIGYNFQNKFWVYLSNISDYSSDVLEPFIGWCPGQLPARPGLHFSLSTRKKVFLVFYTEPTQQTDLPQWSKGMSKSIVGQMC